MGKGDTIEGNCKTKPLKIDFAYSKNMVAQLIDKLESCKNSL